MYMYIYNMFVSLAIAALTTSILLTLVRVPDKRPKHIWGMTRTSLLKV